MTAEEEFDYLVVGGGTAGGVVAARLKVRGIEGLRIADASIMPTLTSVNPVIAILLVGERAADLIREDGGRFRDDGGRFREHKDAEELA